MSAFDTNAGTTSTTETRPENYLEHLVGDGKKFNDQEALAKGKFESDLHVSNLERQIAELRVDVDQSTKITELMDMVRKQNEQPPVDPPIKSPDDTSPDQMTKEELRELITTHISERDTQALEVSNLAEADRVLQDKFGDSAGRVLIERASSLSMSVDELKSLAGRNPKAFVRLMGMDQSRNEGGSVIGGGQRSEGAPPKGVNTRNFAYYQNLRRKDKAKYHAPAMQQEMMNDRTAMGEEAFYSNS